MKFETKSINYFNGCLQLPIPVSAIAEAGKLQQACNGGKTLTVEVKVKSEKRSHNANSYCWALCTAIAKAIRSSKEEVYQQAIKSIGAYTPVPIKADAVERYTEIWKAHGIGWLIDEAKNVGVDVISDADRALLLEDWHEVKKKTV